ncbi:MAG: hypothetical protein ACREQZ_15195, partial [Woeseiaceae bacterium]
MPPSRSIVRRFLAYPILARRDPASKPKIWQALSSFEPALLTAVVVAALAVRVNVIANFNINWDEFFYLSLVHDYLRGRLDLKLQTFHVHFFGWLPGISVNEVDQIIAARAVMLGLHLLTAAFLYRIARRLTSVPAALFAVAAYLSVSYVIRGGASFRGDPIAIALVMAAFDVLLTRRGSILRPALAGLLLALAGMITIKTAIFLPTLAVMLGGPLLARRVAGEAARRAAATALTAAAGFALLYGLHAMTFDWTSARSSVEAATLSSKMVTHAGLFPRLEVLLDTLRWDAAFWAIWLAGSGLLARRIWQTTGSERWRWIEAAALALPVASVAVYRNSFPYFYPFILAPASVLMAIAYDGVTGRAALDPGRGPLVVVKIVALTWFAASLILHGIYLPSVMSLGHQRTVVAAVHRTFPAPTPYLDRSSTVASFPQVGFFMTTYWMGTYLRHRE